MDKLPVKNTSNKSAKRNHLMAIVILAIIAVGIYANSCHNEFVWDDEYLILENTYITDWRYIIRIFTTDLFHFSGEKSNFYRPLQTLSYMLDYSLWQLNPSGYHITNILFHFFNAMLVYGMVHLISRNRRTSFIASLLFVIHPIHTEAVTYIAGRADLLVAFFLLLSFLSFVKHRSHTGRKALCLYRVSLLSFVLALLSKEIAIVFPLILIVYERCFSSPRKSKLGKKIQNRYAAFFVVIGIYAFLRASVFHLTSKAPPVLLLKWDALYSWFLTMSKVLMAYFRLLLLPVGLHMEWKIPIVWSLCHPLVFTAITLLAVIVISTFKAYKKSKAAFFGILWFFVMLLPVSNIVLLNAPLAEHWLYLPSIGFFMLSATGLMLCMELKSTIVSPKIIKKVVLSLLALILIFYSLLTVRRNTDWKDEITLHKKTLQYSPHSVRTHHRLGLVYAKRGKLEEAIAEYNQAIKLAPEDTELHINLGLLYAETKQYDKAEAEFKYVLKSNPRHATAYNNLGTVYSKTKEYKKAIAVYNQAIELNPHDALFHSNLGNAYAENGEFDNAKHAWERALAIDPACATLRENLKKLKQMGY